MKDTYKVPDWQAARESHLRFLTTRSRIGLLTDVDGTISPIVPHPDDAQITPRSRELLAALSGCLTLVGVISGRSAADISRRVALPGLVYVGNHGLERWIGGVTQPDPSAVIYEPQVQAARKQIEPHLRPGMWIEDKATTLSVHYRQAEDPDAVAREFTSQIKQIAADRGLSFFEGRRIFEIRPPIDVNKGTVFRRLVIEYRLEAAIYIGDDVTDTDAFRAARALRESGQCYALGVGVESDVTPELVTETSDLSASGVSGVELLLAWLLSACKASST